MCMIDNLIFHHVTRLNARFGVASYLLKGAFAYKGFTLTIGL